MSVVGRLRDLARRCIEATYRDEESGQSAEEKYPVYGAQAQLSIVWRCDECGWEILQKPGEGVACDRCGTEYSLYSSDETPEALRSRCPVCNNESDAISAMRAENMRFDCPYCPFVWESSFW